VALTATRPQGGYAEQALAEVSAGRIEPVIGQTFPLMEAAQAHRGIESRGTLGETLLLA
jgi:NADPH:quinone reductase